MRRSRRLRRLAALLVLVLAALPGAAQACGARTHAAALRPPSPLRPRALVVGDSTLVLAAPRLGARGLEADAQECRQFDAGLALLAARARAHRLPRTVVLALGANGPVATGQLERALRIVGRHRVLGLVTPRNLAASARSMRMAARRHPRRVLLVDWARSSAGHAGWFGPDGLHVGPAGARAYADAIVAAVRRRARAHRRGGTPPRRRARAARSVPQRPRLALGLPARPRAGAAAAIEVEDRAGRGGLALTLCVQAPARRPRCRARRLARGVARLTEHLDVPRPGRYQVAVRRPGHPAVRGALEVRPRRGRLQVLATGDSMMQLLDASLAARLGPRGVDVRSDARPSTGLTKPFLLDWPAHARAAAAAARPDVTLVALGANDGYAIGATPCCGAAWSAGYAARVQALMRTYARGGRGQVYWLLLPDARDARLQRVFAGVDRGIALARARTPDARTIDLRPRFTPHGFRPALTVGGRSELVRQPDGVHLTPAGAALAAALVETTLRRDGVLVG